MKIGKKKYLPLYQSWIKNQRLPKSGLCLSLETDGEKNQDLRMFEYYGIDWEARWYWGYDGVWYDWGLISMSKQRDIRLSFTPIRQNIVLFMAAMNNEL